MQSALHPDSVGIAKHARDGTLYHDIRTKVKRAPMRAPVPEPVEGAFDHFAKLLTNARA